jgi:hypothetical protein
MPLGDGYIRSVLFSSCPFRYGDPVYKTSIRIIMLSKMCAYVYTDIHSKNKGEQQKNVNTLLSISIFILLNLT